MIGVDYREDNDLLRLEGVSLNFLRLREANRGDLQDPSRHRHRAARQQPTRVLHRARDARRPAAGLRRAAAIRAVRPGRHVTPLLVTTFHDAEGRIKRQAARFQVFVYDDASPEGRPLKIGDRVEGGGNAGTLVDIQWQVYVANKKACWYQFDTTQGEHGYPPGYPRRNADVTDATRSRLIIDPGPRSVNHTTKRRASFDRSGEGNYATTFPPPDLTPFPIDTLGEMMTDDSGRLLVLGGHGRSGSEKTGPGEPHIDELRQQ